MDKQKFILEVVTDGTGASPEGVINVTDEIDGVESVKMANDQWQYHLSRYFIISKHLMFIEAHSIEHGMVDVIELIEECREELRANFSKIIRE